MEKDEATFRAEAVERQKEPMTKPTDVSETAWQWADRLVCHVATVTQLDPDKDQLPNVDDWRRCATKLFEQAIRDKECAYVKGLAPPRVDDVRALIEALKLEGGYQGNAFRGHCPNPNHPKKPGPGSWIIVVEGEKAGLHRCHGCGFEGGPLLLVATVRGIDCDAARRMLAEGDFALRAGGAEKEGA